MSKLSDKSLRVWSCIERERRTKNEIQYVHEARAEGSQGPRREEDSPAKTVCCGGQKVLPKAQGFKAQAQKAQLSSKIIAVPLSRGSDYRRCYECH